MTTDGIREAIVPQSYSDEWVLSPFNDPPFGISWPGATDVKLIAAPTQGAGHE